MESLHSIRMQCHGYIQFLCLVRGNEVEWNTSINMFDWRWNGMEWKVIVRCPLFLKHKNHISKFRKFLKTIKDIDNSTLHQREIF